jgi:hypothetical protein
LIARAEYVVEDPAKILYRPRLIIGAKSIPAPAQVAARSISRRAIDSECFELNDFIFICSQRDFFPG